jgi:hypothetical protein
MITYQEFLDEFIINSREFDEIVNLFPEINEEDINTLFNCLHGNDLSERWDVCKGFIDFFSFKFDVDICDFNLEHRQLCLDPYRSYTLDNLYKFKNELNKWTIINFDIEVNAIKSEEETNHELEHRKKLLNDIRNNASTKQLEEFLKEL